MKRVTVNHRGYYKISDRMGFATWLAHGPNTVSWLKIALKLEVDAW